MSTVGDILSIVGDVQYRGGYHDKCGDIMSTVGVFSTVGVILSTVWDILSTVGDVQYRGGYHEYHGGVQYRWGYHEYRGGYHDACGDISVPWGYDSFEVEKFESHSFNKPFHDRNSCFDT